jgi:hypothetical protein
MLARNWDDFLQRDIKAINFNRALAILGLNTAAFITAFVWTRKLLPIGKFGIRNVGQTQLYQNFGALGVAGAGLVFFGALYT